METATGVPVSSPPLADAPAIDNLGERDHPIGVGGILTVVDVGHGVDVGDDIGGRGGAAAEGHRRRRARHRHAVVKVRGAARLPVIQGDRRPINGDLFVAGIGDVGHGKGQPRDRLPGFHRRDRRAAKQPHRRVPFGEGRVRARGRQRRLVIDRVHIDGGDGHRRARVIAPIGDAPAIDNLGERDHPIGVGGILTVVDVGHGVDVGDDIGGRGGAAAEGHRRRRARHRHAVVKVRGAARLPVIQGDRRPINGDLFVAGIGDVGHGKGQPRDRLPGFHRRDRRAAKQPHRRVPFGEGRVRARGRQRRLVIDPVIRQVHSCGI